MSRQPWHPVPYDKDDVYALKSLATGTANEGQQKHAIKYIVEAIAATYDETYFSDSERNSAYAQGRRFVGLSIVKLINLPLGALERPDTPSPPARGPMSARRGPRDRGGKYQ
jgi:hypothetical protein